MKRTLVLIGIIVISALSLPSARAMNVNTGIDYVSKEITGSSWSGVAEGVDNAYPGFQSKTHPYGKWDDPATLGADAFNYNNPQDHTQSRVLMVKGEGGALAASVAVGAHGGYLTTSHKCRECHASNRSSGTFKLTRSDERFDACAWCHGAGAGSGFNIQTDNDLGVSREYEVGHSMGYGLASGKWKAPDDTYPAYTPSYWLGGFSCFDCHSAHANPQRLLGFSNDGEITYPIYNPGHTTFTSAMNPQGEVQYPAGSWLLLKNPDREIDQGTGEEISDRDMSARTMSIGGKLQRAAVNKQAIDWNQPIGFLDTSSGMMKNGFHISEFFVDCHDGNAGLSTQKVALFSEDRALRNYSEGYEFGNGHDSNERTDGMHYVFDSEDGKNDGPTCRSCHRGSSECNICHSSPSDLRGNKQWPSKPLASNISASASNFTANWIGSKTTTMRSEDWRAGSNVAISSSCCDDGFSWPHKTMGWKMLKDGLFGVDFDGVTPIAPGESRTLPSGAVTESVLNSSENSQSPTPLALVSEFDHSQVADDLDSVCLDCHNPYVWNPQEQTDLLLKGIP
ncbi:MAG: hypothetical protein ACYC56_08650 [Candidatus Aquicultor sp.]